MTEFNYVVSNLNLFAKQTTDNFRLLRKCYFWINSAFTAETSLNHSQLVTVIKIYSEFGYHCITFAIKTQYLFFVNCFSTRIIMIYFKMINKRKTCNITKNKSKYMQQNRSSFFPVFISYLYEVYFL